MGKSSSVESLVTKVPVSGKVFDQKEIDLMIQAVKDGWWTEGRFNLKFEQKLAQRVGTKFAITTNSGSSANLLAITALTSWRLGERRLKKGDEVITLACSFPSTLNPIIQNQLTPVLIDLELGTYVAKLSTIKKAIGPKTRAIFLPHTLGNPHAMTALVNLCRRHRLWLIEDNCDALGSIYAGQPTGSFGHLSTSSFYPAHHITTGEGGAVFTSDPLLHKIIRSIRDWGRDCWCPTGHDNTCGIRFQWQLGDLPKGYDHKYIYSEIGYNLKITDIQAALGLAQLQKLNRFIKVRRQNFAYYQKHLARFKKYFVLPRPIKNSIPSWFGFLITVRPNSHFIRHDLVTFLNQHHIGTRPLFAGNLVRQPYFKHYRFPYRIVGDLANSDRVMNDCFWIGVYPGIGAKERRYIINVFGKFLKQYTGAKSGQVLPS